ncbi:MAG: serine/threonine-protein kinase [Planctomycetota bacterium]
MNQRPMNADRYRRVQDLFWDAESLAPDRRESFLTQQCGDDDALRQEVESLLREHDLQAALHEGNEVRREPMSMDVDSDTIIPDGRTQRGRTSAVKDANSTQTAPGAERTHAAPRTITPSPQGSSRRRFTRSEAARTPSRTLTSIGPGEPKLHWKRRWATLSMLWLVPLLILAFLVGASRQRETEIRDHQRLSLLLEDLGRSIETQLDAGRIAVETAASSPIVVADIAGLQRDAGDKDAVERIRASLAQHLAIFLRILEPDKKSPPSVESSLSEQSPEGMNESRRPSFAVWSRQMVPLAVSSNLVAEFGTKRGSSLKPAAVPVEATAAISESLEGDAVFVGPLPRSDLFGSHTIDPSDVIVGWIAPVRIADATESTEAALFLSQAETFRSIDATIAEFAIRHRVDAYLVDRDGWMLTNSPTAWQYAVHDASEDQVSTVAQRIRVTDPGRPLDRLQLTSNETDLSAASSASSKSPTTSGASDFERRLRERRTPLTVAAASTALGQKLHVHPEPYRNYLGRSTRGAWNWLGDFGLVIEMDHSDAFGRLPQLLATPAGWLSPVWIWWLPLSVLGVGLSGLISWQSAREHHRIQQHRQPLGRYQVEEELGSGGMGIVYRARHEQLGRDIALKILRGDRQATDDQQRFDREARLAATLSNPHCVTIYDYGRSESGDTFCVMQLLRGLTLHEVVARSGYQPVGRVLWILRQICQAMLEAHGHGLMHRDLKPQNVMLDFDSIVGDWAIVFDFGLAKPLEPDPGMFQTAETIWAGTPMYMAPERFRDPTVLDPRSDIYSIGCVAYYLLAGAPPFSQCDPESMFALILSDSPIGIDIHRGSSLDADVNELVMRCMSKDKFDRYGSVLDLVGALESLAASHSWTRDEAQSWWQTHANELMPPING